MSESRMTENNKANPELLDKLRGMVSAEGLVNVSRRLDIGREPLLRYLAGIYLHTVMFRGIEASIAAAEFSPKASAKTKPSTMPISAAPTRRAAGGLR